MYLSTIIHMQIFFSSHESSKRICNDVPYVQYTILSTIIYLEKESPEKTTPPPLSLYIFKFSNQCCSEKDQRSTMFICDWCLQRAGHPLGINNSHWFGDLKTNLFLITILNHRKNIDTLIFVLFFSLSLSVKDKLLTEYLIFSMLFILYAIRRKQLFVTNPKEPNKTIHIHYAHTLRYKYLYLPF